LLIANRENIFNGQYWPMLVIDPSLESKKVWKWIEAKNSGELTKLISKKVADMKKEQDNSDPFAAYRRRYGTTPRNTGINGTTVFNHDPDFMSAAKDVLNFGRLDVDGDDGVWFDNGVTKKGNMALKALSKKKIALHLKNPSQATVDSVLSKTRNPILISGFHDFNDDLLAKVKESKSLIAVDLDASDIDGCIAQIEEYKAAFDTSANIVINVLDAETLPQAKKELYLKLAEKGWSKDEIYQMGGAGKSRRSQGNLDALPGSRARFRR
jgi:hypothetical protein